MNLAVDTTEALNHNPVGFTDTENEILYQSSAYLCHKSTHRKTNLLIVNVNIVIN